MTTTAPGPSAAAETTGGVDEVGRIETRGIETIPEEERHSRPINVSKMITGSAMGYSAIVLGWLPVAFGLSWWSSFTAIIVGALLGSIVLSPMGIFGPRTGTNIPVTSGAHFGVVGRIGGSLVGVLCGVGFTALSVWTGGQAIVESAHRLFGLPNSNLMLGIAYGVVLCICLIVCVWGHANLLALEKIGVWTGAGLVILGIIAFASHFHAGFHGTGKYLLSSYVATWIVSMIAIFANPISYAPFIGDWARYISHKKYSDRTMVWATFGGSMVGLAIAPLFGAFMAVCFANPGGDFISGIVATSPGWYVVVVLLLGGYGALANTATGMYGPGLDTSSLIPRLKRVPATIILGFFAIACVYIGSFVVNALSSISAFLTVLTVVTVPWMLIMVIGHWWRRGHYELDDLQVFNRGMRGGRYWFAGGLNWRAAGAWFAAAALGLLFSNVPPLWVAPLANVAGGVDLSLVSAGVLGAVFYIAALLAFPEPAYVYGPKGPRFGRVRQAEPPPVRLIHPVAAAPSMPQATEVPPVEVELA
ncbi:MAG TPA: cytosine permease [Solirubrobacteraceae bacterium]|nr:cytosine permease [Solirubrobacteraceae bacterium]